jgi:hypothetical protein
MEQGAHENPTKIAQKKARESHELQEGNQRNHECFHTLRGQILYKTVKKIYTYAARKREVVRKVVCPETLDLIYMSPSRLGK